MGAADVIEWGVARRTLAGEAESGDRHVIASFPGGVLVGVVDGLGHGPEAAAAAAIAVAHLERHADRPPEALIRGCHDALQRTRGVAMSVASFRASDSTMAWLGVGNVEGRLVRADPDAKPGHESILLRGGVVGWRLPPLRGSVVPVHRGDMLLIATDGIASDFLDDPNVAGDPQRTADRILVRHGREVDDALVVVARYVGGDS